jgi:hypothetical protein
MNKLKVQDKDAMVLGFSGMRTTSRKELTSYEASQMIRHLKGMDKEEAACDKMRKSMIAKTYEMKGVPRDAGKPQRAAAMKWLNEWCIKFGHGKKPLDEYKKKDELTKLVTQLNKVYNDFLTALK